MQAGSSTVDSLSIYAGLRAYAGKSALDDATRFTQYVYPNAAHLALALRRQVLLSDKSRNRTIARKVLPSPDHYGPIALTFEEMFKNS